ncbi:MAG TPA: hypothetical protein EYG57_01130 [Planctomycetes bacterium]|nr:hypothetical protein [Planctomycetaceae bacterium]HIM28138.1 hypothetical protein [Planctomycetota bacterium]
MSFDPQNWAFPGLFDPSEATVVRSPEGEGSGYWVGAPGAFYDAQTDQYYLLYRIRRPRGVEPDRGAEMHLARSQDGLQFETIWTCTKDQLGTASIERTAVRRLDNGQFALYLSFVDPADGRWRIDVCTSDTIEQFDVTQRTTVFTAADLGVEGVKDPALFRIGGQWQMIVSFATAAKPSTQSQLHGSLDAYNTGLIRSATGLAVSKDGIDWQWKGEIFGPSETGWDRYCARIGTIYRRDGVWLALYDGSASAEENYEEQLGIAYSFDMRTFHRVTKSGPWMTTPHGHGAVRYFDVLDFPDQQLIYFEMARYDGCHDLRVHRVCKS